PLAPLQVNSTEAIRLKEVTALAGTGMTFYNAAGAQRGSIVIDTNNNSLVLNHGDGGGYGNISMKADGTTRFFAQNEVRRRESGEIWPWVIHLSTLPLPLTV